jgi:arsenite methyltransferase
MSNKVNVDELTTKVKQMYRDVAEDPRAAYHFELGRNLAIRLGYDTDLLDRIPAGAVESFAGVGYFFDLADIARGETVVDLGSGSGMDAFYAAQLTGPSGRVIGVDFTIEQLTKARRLAADSGQTWVEFREGRIERSPVIDESVDCVISNGVINLAPDKSKVFREAARLLKRGGRLAIADIVTEQQLSEGIVCNATLWAACIGGAHQQDAYRAEIEGAGLRLMSFEDNPEYQFISDNAKGAARKYGVKSVSVLAVKE